MRRCAECGDVGIPGRRLVRVHRHPETIWKHLDCATPAELRRFASVGQLVTTKGRAAT